MEGLERHRQHESCGFDPTRSPLGCPVLGGGLHGPWRAIAAGSRAQRDQRKPRFCHERSSDGPDSSRGSDSGRAAASTDRGDVAAHRCVLATTARRRPCPFRGVVPESASGGRGGRAWTCGERERGDRGRRDRAARSSPLERGRVSHPATTATVTTSEEGTLPLGSAIASRAGGQSRVPGVPIPDTEKVAVQTRDPGGGLVWGLRSFRTTEGQTCVQIGRVQSGLIGVIGEDGAAGNDHRFHPIAPSLSRADSCSQTDGNGNAFENVIQASLSVNGATGPWAFAPAPPGCGIGGPAERCRRADLRVVQYGLLGPDAISVTYLGDEGRLFTRPTTGSDGAYLIVERATNRLCRAMWDQSGCGRAAPAGYSFGPTLEAGLITAVRYRDGHVCRVPPPPPAGSPAVLQGSCPVIGYVAPDAARHITSAQVVAPVTVRKDPAHDVVDIKFTARVAVTNPNSYYEYTLPSQEGASSSCAETIGDTTADTNTRAGQHVVFKVPIKPNCTGILDGTVAYVPNVGPAGSGYPASGGSFGDTPSIVVGHFSVTVP